MKILIVYYSGTGHTEAMAGAIAAGARERRGIEVVVKKAGSSKIILGIRPEDLRISNKKRLNAIEAQIDVLELVGKELHVYLTAGDSSIVAITDPMRDLRIGKRAWLVFSREKIHLFDGKNGEAIL